MKDEEPIAIAGIGCRFPGRADDPSSFWKLMMDGVDAIGEVPPDRWSTEKYFDPRPGRAGRSISKWGGFTDDPAAFDHEFFGVSPREAASFDPQHKLLLMTAAEALNDASQTAAPTRHARDVGVFVGISTHEFSQLQSAPQELGHLDAWSLNSIAATLAANRISFSFNFSGPSMAVDTACSSSLVAVHLACEAIRRGECSAALAGGANVLYHAAGFVSFSSAGMLSPDGRCKAFDKSGDGFVRAEGAGLVFLMPLPEARRCGLRVYAEILSTAVNQDARKPSLTAPAPGAQAELIRRACRRAGIAPSSIRYIEAHGTGTVAGDPVEARAIGEVVGANRATPCLIGSVKTNIGHLEAAAGIAGLIKAALCLHHGRIPRNLHFKEGNPEIDFEALGLRVVAETEDLSDEDGPPFAGVNSFGFGGANAHAILGTAKKENAETTNTTAPERAALLVLSAKSPESLSALAGKYEELLGSEEKPALEDLCFSAGERQSSLPHRVAIVANDAAEMSGKLAAAAHGGCPAGGSRGRSDNREEWAPVFVFCGQGSQWWQMGCRLLREEPVFRAKMEEIHYLIRKNAGWSLFDELARDESKTKLDDTAIAQPAIFAIQVGLTALWNEWGIRPAAVVGHSVGEAAAAHVAGVLTIEEATRVICQRAQSMSACRGTGSMLSVALPVAELQTLVSSRSGRVAIGAINSPRSAVVSGRVEEISDLARELTDRGVPLRKVRVDYAFHSALMDPAKSSLERTLSGIRTREPAIPLFSTVTATECSDGKLDAAYWWRNIRQPVLFADTIAEMSRRGYRDFLEVGPHPVLAGSMLECLKHADADARVFSSLKRNQPERETLLCSLGAMCVSGFEADWRKVYPKSRSIRLPSYPWKLESTWTELPSCRAARFARGEHPLLGRSSLDAPQFWTGRININEQAYLAGHRVNGQPIFPGAGYMEMAAAAAHEKNGAFPACIDELEFIAAMPVPAQGNATQTRLRFGLDGASFEISSSATGGTDWIVNARGRVAANSGMSAQASIDRASLVWRLPNTTSGEELRENLRRRGLELEGAFAGLQSVQWKEGEALAKIVRTAEASNELEKHHFHPAFLDACFGALACTVPGWSDPASVRLFLPVAFQQVRLNRRPNDEVWAHAKLTRADTFAVEGDLRIYDAEGNCLCEILGFRARSVATTKHAPLDETCVYEEIWESTTVPTLFQAGMAPMLLLSRQCASAQTLQDEWQQAGGTARTINLSCQSPMETADGIICALRSDRFSNIVFLADHSSPRADIDSLPADLEILAVLLGNMAKHRDVDVPPIYCVTRRARAVEEGESVDPFQASLWGLCRTAQVEMPHLLLRLVDIGDADDEPLLSREIALRSDETEVALRNGRRFVSRMRRARTADLRGACPLEEASLGVQLSETGPGVDLRRIKSPERVAPGKVSIRVDAAGVNFRDALKSLGIYPMSNDLDLLLGDECAGEVLEVGAGVGEFHPGDRVVAVTPGSFAAEVVADAWRVAKIPAGLNAHAAATLPVVFLTSLYALREVGRIRSGDTILIHSAAGGVGLAAVQLAKLFGAEVFATAGTEEKREMLRDSGITHVMDSRTLAFRNAIMDATGGRGVDLVLNSLAGEFLVQSLHCLAPGGRFLEIGKRDIYENAKLGLAAFRRNQSFSAIDMAQVLADSSETTRRLLNEISELAAAGKIHPLPFTAYPLSSVADALRDITKGKHTGKLVVEVNRSAEGGTDVRAGCLLRPDATYLVTGGIRGFGFATAKWMVTSGARHIVLVGRHGKIDAEAGALLANWRAAGIEVQVHAADIANLDQVQDLLRGIRGSLPPLRGIIHAATRYESATLGNADKENLEASFGAKARGAWHIHRETTGDPLDFFVLYSSVAGLLGNAGQAGYTAANAFLEALAFLRRAEGRPALAVSWGVVGDTGHVAGNTRLAGLLEARGLEAINAAEAIEVLEEALNRRATHAVVARIDWSRTALGIGQHTAPPRLARLGAVGAMTDKQTLRESLSTMPPAEHLDAVIADLSAQLAEVLRVPEESIERTTVLQDLGLDSLISIETVIRIERRLGISLPPAAISPDKTVEQLATELLRLMLSSDASEAEQTSGENVTRRETPTTIAQPRSMGEHGQRSELLEAEVGAASRLGATFYAEWMVLRLLSRVLTTGSLESARSRLRRLMPVIRVMLRNDRAWALKNLRMVFGPNLDAGQRATLADLALENHLASYIESGFSQEMEFEFKNYAQLLELAGDHGVILCGVHLGSWEPFLRWAPDIGLRLAAVYRPARNPLSEKLFQQRRARYGVEWIPARNVTAIARALENRKIVAFMTDLNVYESDLFVDFLGVPASSGSGPGALAALKGAPIVPAVGIRTGNNKVEATFFDALWAGETRETVAEIAWLTGQITREFEPWIIEYAEQYNWLHPRWRARPDGSAWSLATSEHEMALARTSPHAMPSERILRILGSKGR